MSHEHGRVCAWRARNKKESLISAIVHHGGRRCFTNELGVFSWCVFCKTGLYVAGREQQCDKSNVYFFLFIINRHVCFHTNVMWVNVCEIFACTILKILHLLTVDSDNLTTKQWFNFSFRVCVWDFFWIFVSNFQKHALIISCQSI